MAGVNASRRCLSASGIESDWMNEGAFQENDANTLDTNPPHGEPLDASATIGRRGSSARWIEKSVAS